MLIDKESNEPLMERNYIPCPHCETLNDGRIWEKEMHLDIGLGLFVQIAIK